MQTRSLWLGVAWAVCLAGCDRSTAPAVAPAPAEARSAEPPALTVPTTPAEAAVPAAPDSPAPAPPGPPRGKRAPCTTDQSCNSDASASALWGHCIKDRGVCECNPGFELHPGGFCQPAQK